MNIIEDDGNWGFHIPKWYYTLTKYVMMILPILAFIMGFVISTKTDAAVLQRSYDKHVQDTQIHTPLSTLQDSFASKEELRMMNQQLCQVEDRTRRIEILLHRMAGEMGVDTSTSD